MQELASVLPSTKISHLSVNYSPVGDEGLLAVVGVLADTAIKTLSFKEAEVSDTAVTELAKILQADKTALEGLELSHNEAVTAGALERLVAATKGHSKLAHVGLEGSTVSCWHVSHTVREARCAQSTAPLIVLFTFHDYLHINCRQPYRATNSTATWRPCFGRAA